MEKYHLDVQAYMRITSAQSLGCLLPSYLSKPLSKLFAQLLRKYCVKFAIAGLCHFPQHNSASGLDQSLIFMLWGIWGVGGSPARKRIYCGKEHSNLQAYMLIGQYIDIYLRQILGDVISQFMCKGLHLRHCSFYLAKQCVQTGSVIIFHVVARNVGWARRM